MPAYVSMMLLSDNPINPIGFPSLYHEEHAENNVPGIGLIGAGNMGSALIRGLIASGKASAQTIRVYDVDRASIQFLEKELGIRGVSRIEDTFDGVPAVLVLAVKPQILGEVLDSIANRVHEKLILVSIAAGIPTDFIVSRLPFPAKVIRAMPNAAAMVGASATAMCKAGSADDADLAIALDLFSAVGVAVKVEEKLMNVVTALSGSGPGYLFPMMEALTDAAVLMGMDRPTARALTVQTFLGSAIMASTSGASFSELKDRITSPGGTTITGLHALEKAGLRGILMDAVQAATRRGEELAKK
jgi:pyrroline-5-carboxylate reductase